MGPFWQIKRRYCINQHQCWSDIVKSATLWAIDHNGKHRTLKLEELGCLVMYVRASHIHNKTSYFHFIIGLMAVVFIPCVSIIFWICLNPDMKPRYASSMRVDLDKVVAIETPAPTPTKCRNPI